ncbi:hypothetical protein CH063_15278, partial [Colletotrichum higginsianum]
ELGQGAVGPSVERQCGRQASRGELICSTSSSAAYIPAGGGQLHNTCEMNRFCRKPGEGTA